MREPVTIALVLALAATAHAQAKKPEPKAKAIDMKAMADKLVIHKDEVGNYYVSPKRGAFGEKEKDESKKWVFFGNGKTMYQQRVTSSGESDKGLEWFVWAPRAQDQSAAGLVLADDAPYVKCTSKEKRTLTPLGADEAATMFARAKFYPPLWDRQAHYLARDDEATYYYVDALRTEAGGQGYRIFIGFKGAMKQHAMTNLASDSAGEIFVTKSGKLKIVSPIASSKESKDGAAFWIQGKEKTELTVLPVFQNRYLIYRELGIYGQLGAICDDQ
jgi:hypothetical protein